MTKKEAKTTIHLRGGTSWLDQDSNKVGAYYTPAQRRILCLLVDKTPANGKKWQSLMSLKAGVLLGWGDSSLKQK